MGGWPIFNGLSFPQGGHPLAFLRDPPTRHGWVEGPERSRRVGGGGGLEGGSGRGEGKVEVGPLREGGAAPLTLTLG